MRVVRDFEGFIDLDRWHIKNRKVINPEFNSFSFVIKGRKYFFKELKNSKEFYNELVGYELAKDFGLDAVPYDIAVYDGFNGYISQDYMREGYVSLFDLYKKYFEYDTEDKCNLDDVSMFLRDQHPDIAENVIKDLIRLLEFDIIIGNFDRHDENIIIDTIKGKLAPVFDNEMMLTEDSMYGQFYSFKMYRNERNTVDSLLKYLDKDGLMNFARKSLIISNQNLESVVKRVEKRIGHSLDEKIKKEMIEKFDNYFHFLLRKIDKEMESRYELTKSR